MVRGLDSPSHSGAMIAFYDRDCGFWSNRTLLYFPLSSVRPSSVLRHRRDILTFFDILTVYTMKTIYFLNVYNLGW